MLPDTTFDFKNGLNDYNNLMKLMLPKIMLINVT